MKDIPSFTIDHERLKRGVYVSRRDLVGDQVVTTFDIRMKAPSPRPECSAYDRASRSDLSAQ